MKQLATTRSLSESALEYLKARPGQKFENADIARALNADPKILRPLLGKLCDAGTIRNVVHGKRRKYFAPDRQAPAEVRMVRIDTKPYKLPATLADRGRECAAERAAFPSRHI